jgi:hypothetical protein
MNRQEGQLIREYWSQPNPRRRSVVIRDYARLMHISVGRAEDALDLWVHLLTTQVTPRIQ